jgi:hypothetical protein
MAMHELSLESGKSYCATIVAIKHNYIHCRIPDALTEKKCGKITGVRFNKQENRPFEVGDVIQVHTLNEAYPLVLVIEKKYIKPLLIFDVHGVLGERQPYQEGLAKLLRRKPTREFITRPHCEEFLDFCFEHFEVAVWSSAYRKNLSLPMFGGEKGEDRFPLFIWAQPEITNLFPIMSFRKLTKPLHLKEIVNVWKSFPSYDASNSILLDNDLEKCAVSSVVEIAVYL